MKMYVITYVRKIFIKNTYEYKRRGTSQPRQRTLNVFFTFESHT